MSQKVEAPAAMGGLKIGVLGSLEVTHRDRLLDIFGTKQRALLARADRASHHSYGTS